jgi:hypothetical protein
MQHCIISTFILDFLAEFRVLWDMTLVLGKNAADFLSILIWNVQVQVEQHRQCTL